MIENLSERELEAVSMVLEYVNVEPNETNLRRYMEWDILSFTEDSHDHYCWYMDENGTEICIKVETLEEIDTYDFD